VKAFVTGATGFVGSHLAEALVARGDTVVALARRPDQHEALKQIGVTPASGTLENPRALAAALDGAEIVYHVAGATSARNEAEFFAVNEGGTRHLLDAVRAGVPSLGRFVYVSSQAAIGPSSPGVPANEDVAAHPVTPYGRSKHAGELAVRGSELAWTIVRPCSVYGPRDREFLRLFKLAKRGVAPIFGTGAQEVSLIHIADLVDVIIASGTADAGRRQIFHAAHPDVLLSRDVARAAGTAQGGTPVVIPVPGFVAAGIVGVIGLVAALAGRTTVLSPERLAEFMAPSWLLDVRKAEHSLGWRARIALAEGMAATAAWYREHGWL
jgi:nucleoside-diphosphate-sugar epimerase